jgi:hypothetical protein
MDTVHAGYAGSQPIGTTFLLFEFDNNSVGDTVGVQVICSDSQVSTDPAVFWWEGGEKGKKCVEFSDFAPPRSEDVAYNCQYQVQYLDLQTGTNPGILSMSIYSG